MKLIFNPYFDSKVYVKTNGCTMDEKVVGPQGLLSELELRAGLTGRFLEKRLHPEYPSVDALTQSHILPGSSGDLACGHRGINAYHLYAFLRNRRGLTSDTIYIPIQ